MNENRRVRHLVSLCTGGLLLAVFGLSRAQAATFTTTTEKWTVNSTDGLCSLPEALAAAQDGTSNDCKGSGSANPSVITLIAGRNYQVPSSVGTVTIKKALTIQSATASSSATISQQSFPDPNSLYQGFIEVAFANVSGATAKFQDIVFAGKSLWNGSRDGGFGFYGQGNGSNDTIVLVRCGVNNFDAGGLYVQDISLTVTDSSVDGNGKHFGGFNVGGSGIFIESQDGVPSIRLTVDSSSIVNNLGGGIETETAPGAVSTITSSTVAANHNGPGIALSYSKGGGGSELDINGSTIVANTADNTSSWGIVNDTGSILKLNQSVVDLNAGQYALVGEPDGQADILGDVNSMTNSLLGESYEANLIALHRTNLIDVQSNISTTLATNNSTVGQFPPKTLKPNSGSPLINFSTATNTDTVIKNIKDERHMTRGPNNTKYDIGALEQ